MLKIDKKRILKFLRNILIGAVVLIVLIVGLSVLYVWYTGQQDNSKAIAESVEPVAPVIKQEAKKVEITENTKASAAVQSLTSPIKPGMNAMISVKTNQDAKCKITAVYNKIPSTDSGLVEKQADEYGLVSWTWTVESSAPIGKWPVTVTCNIDENRSAVVVGDLIVVNNLE